MIICKACGHRNADEEDFCLSCGRYLEWAGEHVDEVAEPEPEPDPEPEPEPEVRPGFIARVRIKLGIPTKPKADTASTIAVVHAPMSVAEPPPDEDVAEPASTLPPDTVAVPVVAPIDVAEDSDAEDEAREPALSAASGTGVEAAGAIGASALVRPAVTAPRRPGEAAAPLPAPAPTPTSRPATNGDSESNGTSDARADRGLALRRPTELPRSEGGRRRPITGAAVPELQMTPSPGDVFCPKCGQFNSPTRVYCRRCGTTLPRVDDDVQPQYVPLNFWHRHFRHDTQIVPAGERPGRWGRAAAGGSGSERYTRILLRVGAVVIAAGILLSFIGPEATPIRGWASNVYHDVVHKVDITYTQEFAVGANATTSYPNHPAGNAVNDADNTYWQSLPSKRTHGAGQSITTIFSTPTSINYVGILSGASPTQQAFLSEARPKQVLITFFPKTSGPPKTETLQDVSTFQKLNIHATNATSMTLKVLSVYPSATGNSVAITQIEFFQRS